MMKLAMSSWSLHRAIKSGKINQEGWIDFCARLELDAVELLDLHFPSTDKEYLARVKSQCEEKGLTIACAAVSNDFGLPIKRARAGMERMVRRWIEHSVKMQAPVLRVLAGWPGLRTRGLHLVEKFRLWDEMCDRLNRLATEAKGAGIIMALENHNGKGFTRTADDLFSILEAAPDLRVCLDTGDYLVNTADINGFAALERAAPRAAHVHAKLYNLNGDGSDPQQDWSQIFDILTAAQFNGALSIEYEGEEDPFEAVPKSVKYFRNLMREKGLCR